MQLAYLDFDYSEDALGHGSFEAMASVHSAALAALLDEVRAVLEWAHAHFSDQPAPLDEGGVWDYSLDGQREWSAPDVLCYDPPSGQITSLPGQAGAVRHTVTLALVGSSEFCQALREQFEID